jgi:hypothetical protein
MKERPIVLSGRWLRAALDGKKSQTRRVWVIGFEKSTAKSERKPAKKGAKR